MRDDPLNRALIAPSVLSCRPESVAEAVKLLRAHGASRIHVDHFADSTSSGYDGIGVIELLRSTLGDATPEIDLHLLACSAVPYLEDIARVKPERAIVPFEGRTLSTSVARQLRSAGVEPGLAMRKTENIDTSLFSAGLFGFAHIATADLASASRAFEHQSLQYITEVRSVLPSSICIVADGGIRAEHALPCIAAGADVIVMGSAIFDREHPGRAFAELSSVAAAAADC